jgi:NADH dehydrogenase [ubiquinone] 1 alpha subcomplex assembly factor 1
MKYLATLKVSTTLLAIIFLMTLTGNVNLKTTGSGETILFDFGAIDNMNDWLIVNDGVMGGLSESSFVLSDNSSAVFSGDVTLENNGGFASVRTRPMQFGLDGYEGIQIRVKGDGKKYQFRVQTNNRFDGVSYQYKFETQQDQWQTITIPFEECVPVFRGRLLRNVEPISPTEIRQLGFLISDGQTGDFQLEVQWIKAYQ